MIAKDLPRVRLLAALFMCSLQGLSPADFIGDKIKVVSNRQQIADAIGTAKVKLAFVVDSSAVSVADNGARSFERKSRTICFVDFTPESFDGRIQTIPAARDGLLPVVSPDGNAVTYATGVESDGEDQNGKTGKVWLSALDSSAAPIKISDSGFVPRFVKNSSNPTVLYSTCSKNPVGANLSYTCGKVVKREIKDSAVGPEETVWDGGSYFGGLSYDNRYLATGWLAGDGARMLDLDHGATGPAFIHLPPAKTPEGRDTLVSIGICNPSISSSTIFTNAMMYFDFGAASGFTYPTLGSWGVHTRIFITRIDSAILRWYDMPRITPYVPSPKGQGERTGKDQWDNPEWSSHAYFAAASLLVNRLWKSQPTWTYQNAMTHEQVYAIDLKDSSYLRLLQLVDTSYTAGIDILWPYLWVEMPAGFASEEDANWLKRDTSAVLRQRVGRNTPGSMRLMSGTLHAPAGLKRVSIYTLNGVLLARVDPKRPLTLLRLPTAGTGRFARIIKAEPVMGPPEALLWVW